MLGCSGIRIVSPEKTYLQADDNGVRDPNKKSELLTVKAPRLQRVIEKLEIDRPVLRRPVQEPQVTAPSLRPGQVNQAAVDMRQAVRERMLYQVAAEVGRKIKASFESETVFKDETPMAINSSTDMPLFGEGMLPTADFGMLTLEVNYQNWAMKMKVKQKELRTKKDVLKKIVKSENDEKVLLDYSNQDSAQVMSSSLQKQLFAVIVAGVKYDPSNTRILLRGKTGVLPVPFYQGRGHVLAALSNM